MKILASLLLLIIAFSMLHDIIAAPLADLTDYTAAGENENSIQLSIRSKRNETGNWVTTFAAYGNTENIPDGLNLDLKHTVIQKNKKNGILIQGIFGVFSPFLSKLDAIVPTGKTIGFHKRTGTGISLSNNGRTAERISPKDDFNQAIVVTNRPLEDNELFEVRLDEVISNWAGSMEFGVTSKNPTEIPLLSYFGEYSPTDAWFYGIQEFKTGDIGVPSSGNYKVGDRFGVMRKPDGDLQYFVNGIYVGTATSKVPKEVYGIIDLYANGVKATIINPP